MTEHTPGPWHVVEDASDFEASGIKQAYPVVYIIPAKKRSSAITELMGANTGNLEEIRANARLIAAAPALLEALECYELPSGHLTGCTMYEGNCQPHCEKGRKAIAQAKEVPAHA